MLPDFNQLNPYYLEIEGDELKVFRYYVENISEIISPELLLKENDILNKVRMLKK